MNILQSLNEKLNLNRLKDMSEDGVKNAFMANYIAGLIFIRVQDIPGLHLVNDHTSIGRFNPAMNDITFWARALFYPEDREVQARLQHGHAALLKKEAGRVSDGRVKEILRVMTIAPTQLNWNTIVGSLVLLRHRFSISSSYLDKLTFALYKWDDISEGRKKKAINDSFMYLLQSDSSSALLSRLRVLNNNAVTNGVDDVISKVVGFVKMKLKEDGESVGVGSIGTGDNAIVNPYSGGSQPSTSDIGSQFKLQKMSPSQMTKKGKYIFKGAKIVKKVKKKFKPRKFKAPDFLKPSKDDKEPKNINSV